MTVTLTWPVVLTAAGMVFAFLYGSHTLSVRFSAWATELQTMTKQHEEAILSLRVSRHEHGQNIAVLQTEMDAVQHDVVALQGSAERRKR